METIREVPFSRNTRISWSAVIAGVVIGSATQALLNLLGLGLGFSAFTVNPDVMTSIGLGSIVWFILTGTIALFVGGWVAGRMANCELAEEGLLHGLVTWGLATVLGFALVATAAGGLISGMASVVGQGITLTGQSATVLGKTAMQVAPDVSNTVKNITPNFNDALNQIKQQADIVFAEAAQTSSPNVSNDSSDNSVNSNQSTNVQQYSNQLKTQLEKAVAAVLTATSNNDKVAAQQKLFNILTQNLEMGRDQAVQTINDWQQQFNQLKAQVNQKAAQAKQTAIAVTEQTSNVMGSIAIMSFLVLLIGAVASTMGGIIAATTFRKNSAFYSRK